MKKRMSMAMLENLNTIRVPLKDGGWKIVDDDKNAFGVPVHAAEEKLELAHQTQDEFDHDVFTHRFGHNAPVH